MAKNDKKSQDITDTLATEAQEATQAESETRAESELDPTEGLVNMHKDGIYLHVHPTTVKAHEEAGWSVA